MKSASIDTHRGLSSRANSRAEDGHSKRLSRRTETLEFDRISIVVRLGTYQETEPTGSESTRDNPYLRNRAVDSKPFSIER